MRTPRQFCGLHTGSIRQHIGPRRRRTHMCKMASCPQPPEHMEHPAHLALLHLPVLVPQLGSHSAGAPAGAPPTGAPAGGAAAGGLADGCFEPPPEGACAGGGLADGCGPPGLLPELPPDDPPGPGGGAGPLCFIGQAQPCSPGRLGHERFKLHFGLLQQ
jgi:hypothetical protein